MGMEQGIAILVSIIVFLCILKMAKNTYERMEKEIEEEKKKGNLSEESEQIGEKEVFEETVTEHFAEDQLNENTNTKQKEAEGELDLSNEQLEVLYRLFSGASFIGVFFIFVHFCSRVLSTGLHPIDGILSLIFFSLCSRLWCKYTVKMNDVKRKLKEEETKGKN